MRLLILIALLAVPAFAQETPKPDRWRGLVIGETTPDEAIAILGKPKSDKRDRIHIDAVDSRLITKRQKESVFRAMKFPSTQEMKRIELSFENDKLILITLQLNKEVKAAALDNIYGVQFVPWYRQSTQFWDGGKLKRDNGTVYAKTFPSLYGLVHATETALMGAVIMNTNFWPVPGDAAYPGKVIFIQMISRTLENKDGQDVLK